MYFVKNNFSVYHCHIPRTAGRFITHILGSNGYQVPYPLHAKFKHKEVLHLDRHLADQYYKEHPITNDFALIRNPLNKFAAAGAQINSLRLPLDIFSGSYDQFVYYMHEYVVEAKFSPTVTMIYTGLRSMWNNWFEPQSNFINNKTSLWRFENGINDNFYDWLFENTGVNITRRLKENHLPIKWHDQIKLDVDNDQQLQDNVLRYYNNDYQLWNSL